VLIALQGACKVRLDDGRATDEVMLDDPGKALYVGPWVWHELVNTGTQSTILAIASTLDDEGAYLRDYEIFKREALARP
jgi:mannose-6-phosphate isomerase-like protein (cupin superfamily)